ncbi:MAG: hypothetical protein D8M18_10795 [Bacteroidetes bacterium]|nr:hypothetical protein [Bacteroidota bacterium]
MLGQSFFEADSIQIKTGAISRTYNFAYSFRDSLTLFFTDSVVQYSNDKKTIVKTISYSGYNKKSEPAINIKYFGVNGRDSISKHFYEGKPSMTYKTNYDNIGRIIYYGMKDFNADSTYDRGFEWFYEYRDSSISTGKIEIQTIFVDDAAGDKRFHFRVLNEYDNKNRKIKEIRESEPNDPTAQITIYTYNDQDSLISVNVGGMETLSVIEKHINTKCDIENEYSFVATDYNSIKQFIHQLLIDNKNPLTKDKCENYFLTLISFDKQTRLKILKQQPYHCGGRKVIFSTTIQL